jgi:hypothetical protein
VTGSAIAIPLLGAVSAHAADGTTWDKIAECESGGSWSADNGNGYYGGLQISHEDWAKYGGIRYAENADQASRSQQIAVAERILADQGTTPWATCALLSGMTSGSADGGDSDSQGSGKEHSGHSSSDSQGDSESGKKSDSSNSSDESGSSSSSDSSVGASVTPSPSASAGRGHDGANAPKSDKSASPESGAAQGSEGSATSDPATGDSDNSWQTGGSWSLVDTGALGSGGRHRGGTADESVTNGQDDRSSGRHASRGADGYTVREGETLSSIADSLDVDGGWRALYAQNEKIIGSDPNDITPGQALHIHS